MVAAPHKAAHEVERGEAERARPARAARRVPLAAARPTRAPARDSDPPEALPAPSRAPALSRSASSSGRRDCKTLCCCKAKARSPFETNQWLRWASAVGTGLHPEG